MSLVRRALVALLPLLTSAASIPTPNEIFRREDQCAVTPSNKPEWYERNLRTIRKVYDMTVYPNNVPVLIQGGKAVPKGLFAQNCKGRVSPVGEFIGFEDSIEYFFALAPTPQTNPAGTAFYDAQIVDFVSGCPDVASSLVYFRSGQVSQTGQLNRSAPTTTLSQVAFFKFNPAGEIESYQAWIPNLQLWTKISSGVDYSNMQVQAAAAQGLCPVIQQRCTGANQQYSSVQDCAQQLGAKPFGNFDEAWGDNVACRTIHLILTGVHPEVHCKHVGPTGGGKCVDIDYSVDYFDDDKLFQAPVGSVFTCSGPLQPDNQVGAGPEGAQVLANLAKLAASGQLPPFAAQALAGGGMGGAGGQGGGGFNPLGNSGGAPGAGMMGMGGQQQGPSANGMNSLPAGMAGAAGGMPQGSGGRIPSAAMAGAMGGHMPQGAGGQMPSAAMSGAMGGMPQQGGAPPGYCPCAPGQQPAGNMASPAGGQPANQMAPSPNQPQAQAAPVNGNQAMPQGIQPAGSGNMAPSYGGGSSSGSTPVAPVQKAPAGGPPHIGGHVNGAHAPPHMGYQPKDDGASKKR